MKKRSLILSVILLCSLLSLTQPVANSLLPQVDKRVELLSIVFRLAGASHFTDTLNPVYLNSINNHFGSHSGHPLINYIRTLIDSLQRDSVEIGCWQIPELAVHLSQPPELATIVSISDTSLSDMWDDRSLLQTRLVSLLRQFYREANCEAFFRSQAQYYSQVQEQYEKQGVQLDKKWIENFFGLKTTENYYAVIALCLRDGAYLRVNFKNNYRNTFTIFGCTVFNDNGLPTTFANPLFPRSMLHEYIHAFTNQLIDKHKPDMQKSSEIILSNPEVFSLVKNTFYGNWQFLLYESLVSASSIKYMMKHEEINPGAEKEITAQEKAGFFWMRELVNELNIYDSNRKKYKILETFMPNLINFFTKTAERLKSSKGSLPLN